jgi:hypothetical protein
VEAAFSLSAQKLTAKQGDNENVVIISSRDVIPRKGISSAATINYISQKCRLISATIYDLFPPSASPPQVNFFLHLSAAQAAN